MKNKYSKISLLLLGAMILLIAINQSLIVMLFGIVLLIAALALSTLAVVKHERIMLIFWSIFIIVLFILPLAKPSNDSFYTWLADQHQFHCLEKECLYYSESIKMIDGKTEKVVNKEIERIVTRKSEDYFFFNKKSIKLEDEKGRLFLIEAIGILGGFTTLTSKPVFED